VAININNQPSVEFDIIGQVVRQQIESHITGIKIIIGNFASCGHFRDRYFFLISKIILWKYQVFSSIQKQQIYIEY
jgi:hypothetical protein